MHGWKVSTCDILWFDLAWQKSVHSTPPAHAAGMSWAKIPFDTPIILDVVVEQWRNVVKWECWNGWGQPGNVALVAPKATQPHDMARNFNLISLQQIWFPKAFSDAFGMPSPAASSKCFVVINMHLLDRIQRCSLWSSEATPRPGNEADRAFVIWMSLTYTVQKALYRRKKSKKYWEMKASNTHRSHHEKSRVNFSGQKAHWHCEIKCETIFHSEKIWNWKYEGVAESTWMLIKMKPHWRHARMPSQQRALQPLQLSNPIHIRVFQGLCRPGRKWRESREYCVRAKPCPICNR